MQYLVNWDIDNFRLQDVKLPLVVEVPDSIPTEEIADWISDEYGWCIKSLEEARA